MSSKPQETEVDLPMLHRAGAVVDPASTNAERRTAAVVWSTGAIVRRCDQRSGRRYDEDLSLAPEHVDLSRLNGGAAPVVNTHGLYDLSRVLGVVERAWLDTGEDGKPLGRAIVRFSARADVEPVWQDVQHGILRNVSVGYRVRAFEVLESADPDVPLWRAVDWEPWEISVVPAGADAHAGFRASELAQQPQPCRLILNRALARQLENDDMEDTNPAAETRPNPAEDIAATRTASAADPLPPPPTIDSNAVIAAERSRISGIYEAARKLSLDAGVAEALVRDGTALAEARAAMIDRAADQDHKVETRHYVRMGGLDERETARQALANAILHRSNPDAYELTEPAYEWRGLTLVECGRQWLARAGERVRGLTPVEVAERSLHTTSDFPLILGAVGGVRARDAYAAYPRTYTAVARRAVVPNFKDVSRPQLGEAPQLLKVNEHGEFKRGTIGEAAETYRIATYGRVFGITRQVIINDDLDAFTRIPAMFGVSAATLESDLVWGIITGNPLMADSVNLFHATHKNLAGSGTALDLANLGKARAAMAKQLGLDGVTVLNIRPAIIAIGSSLELTAEQIIAQNLTPVTTATVVPASIRSLSVISEPRLDPGTGAIPWYLFASPATIDTIEYAFLEGAEGIQTETRVGFDIDGVEIKARLDFGAKALDYRGMYKNPGISL